MKRLFRGICGLLSIAIMLSACAVPPEPLQGAFREVTVRDAQQQDLTGTRVRWGGIIVSVNPEKEDTCIEIVSRPLDDRTRPRRTDQTFGRFLVCAPGFYDPAVYGKGREVTVIGALQTPVIRKIGEHDYVYPQLTADMIYLWPERERTEMYYPYPYPDPFWYPWGPWPYGSWYYRPFWGPWPYGP